ncbi:MAG: SpvB/TcaC N-terminal domain-containing protein, partial [Pseudomonadota bacterium]
MSFSFAVYRPSPGRVFERIVALFGLIVLIPASFAPSAYATAVGATPGSYQVSPSGAFTYTIPIAVPPGTAGIEPKLSLSYNSQGGNGLLGMGWSLAGLSVIHRCPKTLVQDGVISGVNYNANDRYCLDGQRLVAISGTYGADGTEYRTESESYSRIVSYGSQGSGPVWWKAWTKSGQILEYGNTADSRIEAQGKTEVMLWSLNKLADTVGNTLTVSYIEDTPNGQYYPDRIDYTGNSNAGKTPTNSVRFVYETRPDITPLYQAGSVNKTTVRLTNVQTFTGSTVLTKDYRLAYELTAATHRSQLMGFTECAGNGVCLPTMLLKWQSADDGSFATPVTMTLMAADLSASYWNSQLGDFNGDGRTDVALIHNGTDGWYGRVALAQGDGSFATPVTMTLMAADLS